MTNDLQSFIAHARKKGMDHSTIRMLLLSSGWKERDVAEAMIEESLEIAVPIPPDTGGARDAFFHLLTFAAFYTWMISLIVLFFDYINRWLPDAALESPYYVNDVSGIRWSIAALIVAFPLFAFLSRFLLKEMRLHPEKSASGIRRWLTYLTLFVAAAALMGDVITLVFYLLEGELSLRFILKVLVVLVLAGISFTYYFLSLRMQPGKPETTRMHRSFGWVASVLVLFAIVLGIIIAGSPMTEREKKFDDRRVDDLRVINTEIRNIVLDRTKFDALTLKQPLPKTLEEVQKMATYQMPNIVDPETAEPYLYEVLDSTRFRLCATFTFARTEQYDVFWNHEAGQKCFEFDVLQEQY